MDYSCYSRLVCRFYEEFLRAYGYQHIARVLVFALQVDPFGPVAAIRGFEKIEDAIAEANRLPFGLAGYAFTSSLKNAHLLAQRLEVGMLWINQAAAPAAELPFGGLKDSGYGSEGGPEAIEAHLNTRLVSIMNV